MSKKVLEIERRVRAAFDILELPHVWTQARLDKCRRVRPDLWAGVSLEEIRLAYDRGEQICRYVRGLPTRRRKETRDA